MDCKMKIDATTVQYICYILGSLFFLAGSVIGLLKYIKAVL